MYLQEAVTILGALIWFLVGYFGREPEENFSPEKVFKTVIAGLIVGVLIVVLGVPEPNAIEVLDILSRLGAIATLEREWKIIVAKLFS